MFPFVRPLNLHPPSGAAPTGACCLSGGSCQVLTQAQCTVQGGTWYANDDCNFPSPCIIIDEK